MTELARGDDDTIEAEVVELDKHRPETVAGPAPAAAEVDERVNTPETPEPSPSKARSLAVTMARPLPSTRQMFMSTCWWARIAGKVALWTPVILAAELKPIFRGLCRVVVRWSAWVHCTELAEAAKAAEGNERSRAQERLSKRRSARAIGSLVVLGAGAGGMLWLHFTTPFGVGVAALALAAVFDVVGRRANRAAGGEKPVHLPTGPVVEGIPLSSLRAEIVQSFEWQGLDEVTVALPVVTKDGWTVDYHTRKAITDDHLKQLERDLDIRRRGITQIVEQGNASRGQLQVMLRDPLANVVASPEPDELSVHRPLALGVTASGAEWVEHFLRTHFTVIGASQSGKSSCLWQITDVLRRCPEVELDAIDLTDGPAFGAPSRAYRRRGFDEDTAKAILTEAVALSKRRNAELKRLSEADDTPDDFDEKWHPTVEERQRVVMIDEFARVAENKELLPLVEYLLRYGAKGAVTVGIASQGSTLADFGTSTVRGQVMLKIMFACSRDDVLYLFGKDARDSGYRPDLFEPANGAGINDAGKCFVQSALSGDPEAHRSYRLDQAEVRRRDRRLGRRPDSARTGETVEAVEVPPIVAAVARVFEECDAERVPTTELIEYLAASGIEVTDQEISDAMKIDGQRIGDRWRPTPGGVQVRGYAREAIARKMRSLG